MADTRHLTPLQHGGYLLLLMTAWRSADCALLNDDNYLSRVAGMDKRTWKANKEVILAFWFLNSEAKLQQKRLLDERKHAEDRRNKNAQAGKASALKRQGRHSTDVQPKSNQKATNPTPIEDSIELSSPPISPKATKAKKHAHPLRSLAEIIPDGSCHPEWAVYARDTHGWSSERIESEWRNFWRYWTGPDAKGDGRKRDWKRTWENRVDAQASRQGGDAAHRGYPAGQGSAGSRDIMASAKRRALAELTGKRPEKPRGEAYGEYPFPDFDAGRAETGQPVVVDVTPDHKAITGIHARTDGTHPNHDDGVQVADVWGRGERDDEPQGVV